MNSNTPHQSSQPEITPISNQKKKKLKGRKQKYAERWPDEELLPTIALQGFPAGERIRQLAADIRREHRTRRKD